MTDDTAVEVYRRRIEADPAAVELVGQDYHDAHPLGRHVEHDERSRAFAHQATPGRVLKSVRHQRHIPILDQGQVGSCTGNSAVGNLATSGVFDGLPAAHPALDEALALGIYSDAEKIDGGKGLPSEDQGSSGLSAAKATNARGLCGPYHHALSVDDAMDALQDGPLMTGMDWHTDMDNPDGHGLVKIGGSIRGGHEPEIDEYVCAGDPYADGVIATEPIIGLPNSWGLSWGYQGRFYMTVANFRKLMAADGDVTILSPANQPVPTPVPPTPVPTPSPQPVAPTLGQVEAWWSSIEAWAVDERHVGDNRKAATAAKLLAQQAGLYQPPGPGSHVAGL